MPVNSPAISDLFELFDFGHHDADRTITTMATMAVTDGNRVAIITMTRVAVTL